MEIYLNRTHDDGISTQGTLVIGPAKFDTLEPPWRNNHPWDGDFGTVSSIPQGRYQIDMQETAPGSHMNNLFGKEFPVLPLLQGVQGRSGIYLHPMNFVHDTHGCIGAGMFAGSDTILQSKNAFKIIVPMLLKGLQSGDVWISVLNDFAVTTPATA